MKLSCDICDKSINFHDISQLNDNVLMLHNYDPMYKKNHVTAICSTDCWKKYEYPSVGCIHCHSLCLTNKWFFSVKFINLGGWTSIKSICSEKCKKEFEKGTMEDEELDMHYSCAHCKIRSKNAMKKCSKCKNTYYCNQECQKNNWPEHKNNCR